MGETAHDIYQTHLDLLSEAVWSGDLETVIKYTDIPFTVITLDGELVVKSPDDTAQELNAFRHVMHSSGATAYHRVKLDAAFDPNDPNRVLGRHRTYVLRGGNYACDPYLCEMTLAYKDGRWCQSHIVIHRAAIGAKFFTQR